MVVHLILLLYHETSNTKTTRQLVFPEFFFAEANYCIKSVRLVNNLAFDREILLHFAMDHSNFQLFTILQYLEKPESKNGTIMTLFLLKIKTTSTEMLLDREKLMYFMNCW